MPLPLGRYCMCLALVLACRSATAQPWLTDQSYRNAPQVSLPPLPSNSVSGPTQLGESTPAGSLPLPTVPIPTVPAPTVPVPTVPAAPTDPTPVPASEGLLEPPPPLQPELPPSLFEQDVESEDTSLDQGPVWYFPWTWIPLDGWDNSAELGINGSAGNSESMSFQTGTRLKRKTDRSLFDLRLTYVRTTADGIETQNNALLYTNFERFLGKSKWNYFVKNGVEYDEFKAFDLRYFINSGLGYSFYRTDDLTLTGRFGAGASREFGGPNNVWTPEALFGGDYEHQVNARNKLVAKIDFYPEWGNFGSYRIISDLAWEYLIDADGNLSFKLGAIDRYDSTPLGRKPNDINYSAMILYKF